jgi:hypothetical protein
VAEGRAWDLTVKVVGHGCDVTVVVGPFETKPTAVEETDALDAAEIQFRNIFNVEPQTSAVTVGPRWPEGDDGREVG